MTSIPVLASDDQQVGWQSAASTNCWFKHHEYPFERHIYFLVDEVKQRSWDRGNMTQYAAMPILAFAGSNAFEK